MRFCEIVLLHFAATASGLALPSVDRIVDGSTIDIERVPYMLSYMINGQYACSASILNNKWALTAAHCVAPFVDDSRYILSVRSGSNRYDAGGTVHNVTKVSYHEKFDVQNNDYDIAAIEVHPPFSFDDVTRPLKLPDSSTPLNTSWGLIAGWGYFIESDPVLSADLRYVIVPKVNRKTCVEDYRNRYTVTPRQVCYGFAEGGEDACKGDSGGPLVNNFTIIGITSWGADCGQPNSPGVYTDVIALVKWIKSKTAIVP